ncbi:MAG: hypothetical protein KIS92_11800 [Planctomycetota bacterium]|nr:hypothetical protein [Planctomycetota bacterium]
MFHRTCWAVLVLCAGALAAQDVPLLEEGKPAMGWDFGNGPEFPGAKGSLEADAEVTRDGKPSLRLKADLTGGGNYVQMGRNLDALKLDLDTLSFWLKAPALNHVTMRLIDGSGQCHQLSLKLEPISDEWRLVTFPVDRFFENQGTTEAVKGIAKYEHWGGKKDGKWHGALKGMYLLAGRSPTANTSTIWVSGLVASVRTAAYACDFEGANTLPAGWTSEGAAKIDEKDAFQGKRALRLSREQADVEKPCSATGSAFAVTAGAWEITGAVRTEMESQDMSYNGTLSLELLDAGGKKIDAILLAEPYGKRPWQVVRKRVDLPRAAASARFAARMNKSAGSFWIDQLGAAAVTVGRKPSAVNRAVFGGAQLGNLFKPEDPKTFTVTVETTRELAEGERKLAWVVRDYWGAEQAPAGALTVEPKGKNKERFRYEASLDLAGQPLETGRYYELHASVPLADNEPYKNYAGFAILPLAKTKAYKPEQIPFTSRNWDNRIPEFLRLTDRLGIRVCGIWGGADPEPPHKTWAPGLDICTELGMGVLTGNPGGTHAIENRLKGYEKWTDDAIRGAIRAWIAAHGKQRPLAIDLGNEPHNTGERVKEAVRAYKVAYEEIKKIDPTITVIATSVPPEEEYFAAGYGDACDVFDFHVYEDPKNVREAIKRYQALMEKYKCVKPVWSTEIGLNSQGLTRQHIAGDMIRKFAAFFGAGGANISWFDLLYPDPDAKIFGSGGDSMNVFDSRYNKYAARLDAVTLYNLVNGICVKKCVAEAEWRDGIHACLFRDGDGQCFTLFWKDKGRQDVFLPLEGVKEVQAIRIDGRRSALNAGGKGLTLTVGEDPLLLSYAGPAELPKALGEPAISLARMPAALVRGMPGTLELAGAADPKLVSVVAPFGWKVEAGEGLRYTVATPETSAVREGDLLVRLSNAEGAAIAELACRPVITGQLTVEIRPVPPRADGKPGAQVLVSNFAPEAQTVTWSLALKGERALEKGDYAAQAETAAYLAEAANGTLTVPAKQQASVVVPIANADPVKVYAATATVTDAAGGSISTERCLGGFVAVHRVKAAPKLDGDLSDEDWKRAPVHKLDQAPQYFTLDKSVAWKGKDDLSATMRYLWDDTFLYVGVDVSDDVNSNTKEDGAIWAGDGLQFLVDPKRTSGEKAGKYDLGMAAGKKGPQAWCFLSANAATPAGKVPDIAVTYNLRPGGVVYELAIPWSRLAPFQPAPNANLGLSMIVNEDDGKGRTGFIGWFGNPHTKNIDTVGDLILLGE